MFLVHTDELAKLLESHRVIVKLFADDVKVYLEIVNVSDTVMVQGALDLLNGSYIYCLSANAMLTIIGHVSFDVEYHMSLLVGTWELSLHKISLRQSTLAKLPLKHINVLTVSYELLCPKP